MYVTGYLRYTDFSKKHKDVHYPNIEDLETLSLLRQLLNGLSYADVTKAAITHAETWYPSTVDEGWTGLRLDAKLIFLDMSTFKRGMLTIPAPRYELFEQVMKKGFRIPKEIGDSIIAAYGIIIKNNSLRFVSGWLIGATKP